MNCPNCQHENSDSARFCEACGSKLDRSCDSCGENLSSEARFCPGCGTAVAAADVPIEQPAPRAVADYTPKHLADKILNSRVALEGERKQVTVLFADVKGSMELAGQLDPEAWHEILDRFFAILSEGIHRFEGTVNQYTGDGIMALFGAPIAHEDHAQRACYAAIHLRDQLRDYADRLRIERGIDFGVRIGLNSGEVVVGKIGDDLRMDYTAQGHTVGLAQRIEQFAAPGRIYLSEHTQYLVEGFFTMRDLGASEVAGADAPVGIYELEGASTSRTRLDVARVRGLTRFVGRTDEMRTLESALERAREGHGQVVGVVGDAGLGKSRLCFEFVERCRGEGIAVYEAHCPAHGKNIPLIPMLELFRSYFGITAQDSPAQARQKIAGALVLLDPAMQEALPVLFDFMGVADTAQPAPQLDADARQRRLFALMRQVYRVQAERGIVAVFYIDDMHWIDPASDAFVTQMVEATTEDNRNVLLLNFRPEYEADWMRRGHYHQLPLVPLGLDAIQELVESLLGNDPTIGNLGERIMRWTGGNPFYTEEVVHELVEGGHLDGAPGAYTLTTDVDKLQVPPNVRAVLAARIDRLPESAKRLLQAASVIGKTFPGPVLEAAADLPGHDQSPAIERLKTGDFIFETALYPEIEYAFKHPLTQEVAYASLLQGRRATIHAAAARAFESRAGAKLDEQAALLAYHWDAAAEPAHAIEWHRRAAEWCGLTDASGALAHWQRVRDLAAELPKEKQILALGARACAQIIAFHWRLGASRTDLERDLEEGRALAEDAGDKWILAALHGAYSGCVGVNLGYANEYLEYALEAVRIAEMTDDDELKFAMRGYLQAGYLLCGQFEKAYAVAETTPRLSEIDDFYGASIMAASPRLLLLINGGLALSMQGRRAEGQRLWDAAGRNLSVERFQDFALFARVYDCHTSILYGEFDSAFAIAQDVSAQIEKVRTNIARVIAIVAIGEASLAKGEHATAAGFFQDCLRIIDETNSGGMYRGAALGYLCDAHLAAGETDEATRCAEEAVGFCRQRELKLDLQPWLALVRSRTCIGDQAAAREALEETQRLINETCAIVYQPFLHECRAAFAEAFESEWSSADEIREAHRLFTELGATGHADRVKKRGRRD